MAHRNYIDLKRFVLAVAVTVTALAVQSSSQEVDFINCLPNNTICDRVKCAPLRPCLNGIIVEKGSRCKCCSVCVELIDEKLPCPTDPEPDIGPVYSQRCKAGFHCAGGVCKAISDEDKHLCLTKRDKILAAIRKFPRELPPRRKLWLPECDEEGKFRVKQCQEQRCFCVDKETGSRTFGQEETDLSVNVTCACSHALHNRKKRLAADDRETEWHTYEQEHCSSSGNYEDLQCFKDTCFCVNPHTGVPEKTMVKIKQRDLLPCYDTKLHKESYLTPCEKQLVTERKIIYDFFQKNIVIQGLTEIDCDLDGSFVRRLCKPEICYCSDREGISFGVYKKDKLNGAAASTMNCLCARDEEDITRNHARYELLECNNVGNFNSFQCFGDKCICVDSNGDKLTETIELSKTSIKDMLDECNKVRLLLGDIVDVPVKVP